MVVVQVTLGLEDFAVFSGAHPSNKPGRRIAAKNFIGALLEWRPIKRN
jgi:hypothetical protein